MQVGDIVYFKNIVFDGGKADHAFDVGRPCVYIGTLNGKMYFVPLTNVYTLKHNVPYTIKPNRQNCLRKESHPNFKQIVEKKESFYEVSGYLSEQEMIKLFKDAIIYISEIRKETDSICVMLAKEYLDKRKTKYKDKDLMKQDKKKK